MSSAGLGHLKWIVPDGYLPTIAQGQSPGPTGYSSHESICVLNACEQDASLKLTIYFEDQDPVIIENVVAPAQRSKRVRMEQLKIDGGPAVPRGCPYSVVVESSVPVVIQMSRLDTTQKDLALFSVMGYPVK